MTISIDVCCFNYFDALKQNVSRGNNVDMTTKTLQNAEQNLFSDLLSVKSVYALALTAVTDYSDI